MLIRRFRSEDARQCVRILHDNFHGFKESRHGYIPDEVVERRLIGLYSSDELLRRSERHSYWVAEDQGRILGLVGLKSPVSGRAEVVNFYIGSNFSRRGIGRKLLSELRQHALQEGITRLFLYSVLTAHDAYEKLGFTHSPLNDKYLQRAAPVGFNSRFACSHVSAEQLERQPRKLDQHYFEMEI